MPQCCREILLVNPERSRRNRLNFMSQILATRGRIGLLVLATTMFRAVVCAADSAPTCGADLLTEKAVIDANERFQRSMIASDVLEMGRLLSSDFLYFTFSGEKRDRAELLRSYGAKEVRLKRYDIEDVRVRLRGSEASLPPPRRRRASISAARAVVRRSRDATVSLAFTRAIQE